MAPARLADCAAPAPGPTLVAVVTLTRPSPELLRLATALASIGTGAGRTSCSLALIREGGDFVLELRDEHPREAVLDGEAYRALAERALALGADLHVDAASGAGTVVRLRIPSSPAARAVTGGARRTL